MKVDRANLAGMLDGDGVSAWLLGEIDDLAIAIGVEAAVPAFEILQDRDDDRMTLILGHAHLFAAFGRCERGGAGQKNDRFTSPIGAPERILPALARADAL